MSSVLDELASVIESRRRSDPSASYTARLLEDGELNRRKIMEEAFEVCLELGRAEVNADLVAGEAADLVYHLMVGMAGAGVDPTAFLDVLEKRRS
jgi:phosphoribosyl-ATP pyrophosphohydrolase